MRFSKLDENMNESNLTVKLIVVNSKGIKKIYKNLLTFRKTTK